MGRSQRGGEAEVRRRKRTQRKYRIKADMRSFYSDRGWNV